MERKKMVVDSKVFKILVLAVVTACADRFVCEAAKQPASVDLLTCIASTDLRLEECGIYGFGTADPELLGQKIAALPVPAVTRRRAGFWMRLARLPRLFFRGLRHFIVPKALVVLGLDDEPSDSESTESEDVARRSPFEIDHKWAFERNHMETTDSRARAWQRG